MEELLMLIHKYVNNNELNKEDLTIILDDSKVLIEAKRLNVLDALNDNREKKEAFFNTILAPLDDQTIMIFSNFMNHTNEKDNGYSLVTIKNYTPQLISELYAFGITKSESFNLI